MTHLPEISGLAATEQFRRRLVDLLVEICRIDTSIRPDVSALRQAESRVFDVLERELGACGFGSCRAERRPIDPAIGSHPQFTRPYYTQSPDLPDGLSVEHTYAGRCNLYFFVDGDARRNAGVNQAINAHVDTVAPFFGPRVEGDRVVGRGTCDDKGSVVSLIGALSLVTHVLKSKSIRLNRRLTVMFVIDEEMGGSGSLSAAIDRDLSQRYDSMMVLECCGNRIHPGNRGAVWYRVEAKAPGVNMFEALAFVIEELENEGRAVRDESDHPLFPHRPVQTCHGIIGNCGEHPSRINADVSFDVRFEAGRPPAAGKLVDEVIATAIAEYTARYGDKTTVFGSPTCRPKVDHHYEVRPVESGYTIRVLGSSGHMGAIEENDCAITKMATIVRTLISHRGALENAAGGKVQFHLSEWDDPNRLILEGGQGFLPSHTMDQVQRRMRRAVFRGADNYLRRVGANLAAEEVFEVTYDKLHNAAFAGAPDSADMRNAIAAARSAGTWRDESIRGWDVSCDSRIFAGENPGMPVLTAGPGKLAFAHSDREQIEVGEMIKAAEFLAHFILRQTGTIVGSC